jgi:hypothetical protein
MTAVNITLTVDPHGLADYSDKYLAAAWHAVQHAPGPFGDPDLEDLAEKVGREIIRRWLRGVEPEMWHRQGRHVDAAKPATLRYVPPPGTEGWVDGGPHPDWHYGTYELRPSDEVAANVAKFNTAQQAVLADRRARRGEPDVEEAQRPDVPDTDAETLGELARRRRPGRSRRTRTAE